VQRLGKNLNGYLGETIDIGAVLADCVAAARAHNWSIEEIPAGPKPNLLALTRPATVEAATPATSESLRPAHSSPHIYLSTGIHGDEPAGPLAMRQLLQENQWPRNASFWICPCVNPTGFALHQRENSEGIDLNRQYLQPKADEIIAHIKWLEKQPEFDFCLALHEDWESHGFYVYELNPDNRPSLAEAITSRVSAVCPIDPSELIEGRPAQNGIIRPIPDPITRLLWPEAFYLLKHKTRLSYTVEAPSDFPLSVRVNALVTAVRAAVEAFQSQQPRTS
jgi:hypothetical protein